MSALCVALVCSAVPCFGALKLQQINFFNTEPFNPSISWANARSRALTAFSFTINNAATGVALSTQEPTASAQIRLEPLFYPNPFRLSDGAELGYQLSKNLDIEIRIYNMYGQEFFRDVYKSGTNGGFGGDLTYNKIAFTASSFGGHYLPAGIYFFILINDGKVLGKGKFAIKP